MATGPAQRKAAIKVYIAGPITGHEGYRENFNSVAERLRSAGMIPLNPATADEGMSASDYMRLSFAQIDCANAVLFLPGYEDSKGAMIELAYCKYIGKPTFKWTDKKVVGL